MGLPNGPHRVDLGVHSPSQMPSAQGDPSRPKAISRQSASSPTGARQPRGVLPLPHSLGTLLGLPSSRPPLPSCGTMSGTGSSESLHRSSPASPLAPAAPGRVSNRLGPLPFGTSVSFASMITVAIMMSATSTKPATLTTKKSLIGSSGRPSLPMRDRHTHATRLRSRGSGSTNQYSCPAKSPCATSLGSRTPAWSSEVRDGKGCSWIVME
mmetsp:Transcript_33104/g.87900  ORF Transcript_33104/g.87900 Transcript_33104/m.87900 type:complete len:211 (-) Transcript_33104:351-983(-)